MQLYLLSEAASGYALFEVKEADVIASQVESMQSAMSEYPRFSKMVKLKAFAPFRSAEHALENANMLSEGGVSEYLSNFLETNLPLSSSKKKSAKNKLGVSRDPKFKSAVSESLASGITVIADDYIEDLLRAVRMHFHKFVSGLNATDEIKAQLGLAHSYSRSKVKFNVHKSDNMIIQSIALLDQLDKDINTFAMRVREWYSWHFPELIKIVTDNIQYARVIGVIKNKSDIVEEEIIPQLNSILSSNDNNDDLSKDIINAAKSSMGTDISDVDLININMFAARVVHLAEYRQSLHHYLISKMSSVAPNLAALIGEQVGARLISHAGSLTNLAKYPASTVQILGAEKALFRALKTKGKTPKYGLLYHSTFIGRAKTKNKGRISRYLANKCSIASRMDCFSEVGTDVFGKKLRDQVEERLRFYETGTAPRKNIDVMKEAIEQAEAAADAMVESDSDSDSDDEPEEKTKVKSKKTKKEVEDDSDSDEEMEAVKPKTKKEENVLVTKEEEVEVETPKSKKNKKKSKKVKAEKEESTVVNSEAEEESSGKKEKKKKRKSSLGGVEKKKKKRKSQ